MSEYWVSKKKYFCKYCEIYIADDAPSRQQHENGLRHKGNKERFVRNIYKTGEKRKKDLEEEKREMARVERAAQAAFAHDVGAGHATATAGPSTPSSTPSTAHKPPPPKPSNPYSNYSTAESLGYTDPDAERLKAEVERHRTQGIAGAWELVPPPPPALSLSPPPEDAAAIGQLKREADPLLDDEDTRHYKLRKKTLGVGLGEIYDPGLIPIKIKKKEDPPQPILSEPTLSNAASDSSSEATAIPKWTKVQWRRPGEDTRAEDIRSASSLALSAPMLANQLPEETHTSTTSEDAKLKRKQEEVKIEEASSSSPESSLFRKRKVTAGGAGVRGRR